MIEENLLDPYGINFDGFSKAQENLWQMISPEHVWLCKDVFPDFENLRQAAAHAGFSIKVESGYRSFERQLSIWNRKAKGELPLLNENGKCFREKAENDESLMRRILLWSALPGASRHHFGTDIDVVDSNAIPKDYNVELTPSECEGMFAPFHAWLSEQIESNKSFGFARVFEKGRGKIQPEPWHLSHLPTARRIQEGFKESTLRKIYEESDLACKESVLSNLPELLENYVYPYFL